MFLPGDSVTIQFCSYSTKHEQPSWFIRKTPMRLNNRKLKIEYPTPIQRLLSNDNWLELDSDFEQGGDGSALSEPRTLLWGQAPK